jgi:methyl-accepting chemotaxis protein
MSTERDDESDDKGRDLGRDLGGDLAMLRDTTSKVLLAVLWLHVPIAVSIGLMRGTGWLMPAAVLTLMALAATLSWRSAGNALSTRLIVAVALMGGVSMLVYQLTGHAWQIDMHMYFFAALACLVAYCDYRPIIAGTIAVALHHLALNFILPAAIYPGGTDFGRVVLHAVILLIEAGVLMALGLKLSQLFETTARKTAEAEKAHAAEARANSERNEAARRAKQDRDAARRELAAGFERKIGSIVEAVAVAVREMQGMSASMRSSSTEAAQMRYPKLRLRKRAATRHWIPRFRGVSHNRLRETAALRSSDYIRLLQDGCAARRRRPRTCRACAAPTPGSRPPPRAPACWMRHAPAPSCRLRR